MYVYIYIYTYIYGVLRGPYKIWEYHLSSGEPNGEETRIYVQATIELRDRLEI